MLPRLRVVSVSDRGKRRALCARDSPGSLLYALRQSDGGERWPAKSLPSGDDSTPSLDGSNVYVSLAGPQTYAFDRATGAERWHYSGRCTGGGGSTTMVSGVACTATTA